MSVVDYEVENLQHRDHKPCFWPNEDLKALYHREQDSTKLAHRFPMRSVIDEAPNIGVMIEEKMPLKTPMVVSKEVGRIP